jgi:hypothetical protein
MSQLLKDNTRCVCGRCLKSKNCARYDLTLVSNKKIIYADLSDICSMKNYEMFIQK